MNAFQEWVPLKTFVLQTLYSTGSADGDLLQNAILCPRPAAPSGMVFCEKVGRNHAVLHGQDATLQEARRNIVSGGSIFLACHKNDLRKSSQSGLSS